MFSLWLDGLWVLSIILYEGVKIIASKIVAMEAAGLPVTLPCSVTAAPATNYRLQVKLSRAEVDINTAHIAHCSPPFLHCNSIVLTPTSDLSALLELNSLPIATVLA